MKIKGRTVISRIEISNEKHYACKDIEGNMYIPYVICKNPIAGTFDVVYLKVPPFDQLETVDLENEVNEE